MRHKDEKVNFFLSFHFVFLRNSFSFNCPTQCHDHPTPLTQGMQEYIIYVFRKKMNFNYVEGGYSFGFSFINIRSIVLPNLKYKAFFHPPPLLHTKICDIIVSKKNCIVYPHSLFEEEQKRWNISKILCRRRC